jgi:hypothetical protein
MEHVDNQGAPYHECWATMFNVMCNGICAMIGVGHERLDQDNVRFGLFVTHMMAKHENKHAFD